MHMIAEAIECLQTSAFLEKSETNRYETFFKSILEIQSLFEEPLKTKECIIQTWGTFEKESCAFFEDFDAFKQEGCVKSKSFF